MPGKNRFKSGALQYAYNRYVGKDERRKISFEGELASAEIASQIFTLRAKAGISQRELAARVGTTASVICRLEDADYEGHSLSMLRRIAGALGKQVKIRFIPAGRKRAAA